MLRRKHSPKLLSNFTKEDDRRTFQRANLMAKEVTLGVQTAIWSHQETHLPYRAERTHNFHPVGFDNCSEPIFLDVPTLPLEYGSFTILLVLYHVYQVQGQAGRYLAFYFID